MTVLLPVILALCAAPVALVAGSFRPNWGAYVGAGMAALACGATLWGWSMGGGTIDIPWAPTWDLRLTFTLDGLAALYALLATGIGTAVLVYSSRYLPDHLHHQGRPATDAPRFYAFILLFMGAMVGLVMAQDLILIFLFWDLTAIASYFLIGYDNHKEDSRESALMALLVTGVSAVLFLIGAFMLYIAYGTFSLPTLIAEANPGPLLTTACALIAIAGLAKSAQVPLHFWLPRAMAAPTPVSSYLHSAAMVAAGVFLIGRFYPLIQQSELLLNMLLAIGMLSMTIGGIIALTRDVLKQLLAYSTIAQYGYVVVMFGLGGEHGAVGASFYVIAHALAKCALFLTAGAVTEATGENRLSHLGGLRTSLPLLAIGSGAAAAGLAALPLTVGFFKDELFFDAALEHGWAFGLFAIVGASLTLAYTWRFWSGIFLGQISTPAHKLSPVLVAPIAVLGLLVIIFGIVVEPVSNLAAAAAAVSYGEAIELHLAYHLDTRPANLMALATLTLGVGVIVSRPAWIGIANVIAHLGERIGPSYWYNAGLKNLNAFSHYLLNLEVSDLRSRISTILIPTALLVGLGLLAAPPGGSYRMGVIEPTNIPLIAALSLAIIATVITTRPKNHLTFIFTLSAVGYTLAVVYAFIGAPDVALVAVLIESVMTVMFVAILMLFSRDTLQKQANTPTPPGIHQRDMLVGFIAGTFALVVTWGVFSQPSIRDSVSIEQTALTPSAHAKDVVTAILADFRGLDTMGEITVVTIALLGITTLLHYGRRWQ